MTPQENRHWLTETLSSGGLDSRAKQLTVPLVGMLLIAVAGAIFNCSWWLEYVLIAPSAIWLIVSGRLVVYRQLSPSSTSLDRRVPVVLVVPVLLAAAIEPTRFSGLVVAAAFTVLLVFGGRRADASATVRTL